MQGYNHVAGGWAFTATFASFHDVNVFSEVGLIATTTFCALVPDIDHTRSSIGKVFYPLASWLQRRFGHRTLTHSIFFYSGFLILTAFLPKAYFICGAYALGSHLLFDMCTKQGVPLLYPLSKRPFVLPGNPALRISTQDHRSEAIVFVVFCSLLLFCRPLFAKGFWTSYNEAFSTWEHVQREAKRSPTLIRVYWHDVQKRTYEGLYWKTDGKNLVIITPAGFSLLNPEEFKLDRMEHSAQRGLEQRYQLMQVSPDSLNRFLNRYCLRIQVQSTEELYYYEGLIMKAGSFLDVQYKKGFTILQKSISDTDTQTKIQLLELQRKADEQKYQVQLRDIQSIRDRISRLQAEFDTSGHYRRGTIIEERMQLEAKLRNVILPEPPNLEHYSLQIDLLRKSLVHETRVNANLLTLTLQP